mgnify:CR=1 FL=1
MSMPTFPKIDPPLSREGSLNEIISSIAAEELSLSHILNAEGEKLQYVLGTLPGLETKQELLLCINKRRSRSRGALGRTLGTGRDQQQTESALHRGAFSGPEPLLQ